MTTGRLAIWNDCRQGHEAAYEAWYQGEHLAERVGIYGFRHGRRFEALSGSPKFFTYYEVDEPVILTSAPYLERVNNPTPLTHEIMSNTFVNMSRTICRVTASMGEMHGAWAVTREELSTEYDLAVILEAVPPAQRARVEIWEAVPEEVGLNAEQHLRGPDTTVSGCVLIETLRQGDAEDAAKALGDGARIWRLLVDLTAS